MSGTASGPLVGIRVLEFSHIVAGPSAGLALAELGADTIRVEPPVGGDLFRTSARTEFPYLNRNKRSIAVDLKSPEGLAAALRLVATADVVLDNFAPGTMDRLGLSYGELDAINPRIIYLSIKGFLPGPYYQRQSLDELAQMAGGLAFMTGDLGKPRRAGASVSDVGAATYGVMGVLVALIERGQTGRGQRIDAGLYETIVYLEGTQMANAAVTGAESIPFTERPQARRMGFAVYHLFDTSDGEQVFIAQTSNSHWARFCAEFGLDDLLADARLTTNPDRAASREWLIPELRERLKGYTSSELQEKLDRATIPFAPIRRPDELDKDPHLLATGQIVDTPFPHTGMVKLPNLPYQSSSYRPGPARQAPGRGEHTAELLTEIGYSAEEVQELAANETILLGGPLDEEWPEDSGR